MKMFLVIALTFASFSSFSDDQMKGEAFAKVKEMMLSNIDKRIGFIQNHKSCVSSAADKNALKACREKHKAEMSSLKEERKAMRAHFKEEMKSRREERKTAKGDAKAKSN